MSTKGAPATGTTLAIGTPGGGETFVVIGQVKSLSWDQPQLKTEDATNLGSPTLGQATIQEYLPTSIEPGKISGSVIYLPGDAGQTALNTAFPTTVIHDFKIQFPPLAQFSQTTTGDLYTFSGFVLIQNLPDGLDAEKIMTAKFTIQLTTAVTRVAGS